jgi:hypothetical protein
VEGWKGGGELGRPRRKVPYLECFTLSLAYPAVVQLRKDQKAGRSDWPERQNQASTDRRNKQR